MVAGHAPASYSGSILSLGNTLPLSQAVFDDKLFLEAIRLCSVNIDTVELVYLLKPLSRAKVNETPTVQFPDASGRILGQVSHVIDNATPTIEQGGYRLRRKTFFSYLLQDVTQVSLAMYTAGKKLYPTASWKGLCERHPGLH